jgi:uncharacterized protein (UPF0548 family)
VASVERVLGRVAAATVTYPEVGGTSGGVLPGGYRMVDRRVALGAGEERFAAARRGVFGWAMQRRAGWRVYPEAAPEVGTTVVLLRGPFVVPCRVVWVIDEADRVGFGYGTLPGHPECGEEAFLVERDGAGQVWFRIRAFSRAATWYARLGGPVTRLVQRKVTDSYLRSL